MRPPVGFDELVGERELPPSGVLGRLVVVGAGPQVGGEGHGHGSECAAAAAPMPPLFGTDCCPRADPARRARIMRAKTLAAAPVRRGGSSATMTIGAERFLGAAAALGPRWRLTRWGPGVRDDVDACWAVTAIYVRSTARALAVAGGCLLGGRSLVSFGRCLSVAMWRSGDTRPVARWPLNSGFVTRAVGTKTTFSNVFSTRLVSSTAAAELGAHDIHVRSARRKRDQRPAGTQARSAHRGDMRSARCRAPR